jgi:hypothetical protein
MSARETSTEAWRDLVDRASAYDIRYLMGGSDGEGSASPYAVPDDVALPSLLLDLARAPEARLRNAVSTLLLRHPEAAHTAEIVALGQAGDDPTRQWLLVAIVVAAALQCEWSFALGVYLPGQPAIEADHLAANLKLPAPSTDFGRPCLKAAASLMRRGEAFPFNYEADWEDGARRLLAQLAREARTRGS